MIHRKSSCLALLTLLIGFVLAVTAIVARADEKKTEVPKSTIAVFTLKGDLLETPSADPMTLLTGGVESTTLQQLVARMKQAETDQNVKAVAIIADGMSMGLAQVEELGQSIKRMRKAGKDVYVHADSLGMGGYVLFSGATRLSVVPTGDLWIAGLYGEAPYLRGLLNKLGVTPDYLTCGAYKSAGEIFTREGPSPEADAMQNWLMDSMYETAVDQIAEGRGVEVSKARGWIDNGPYTATKAKDAGIIDAVEQRHDFQAMLQSKYGDNLVFEKKYGEEKQPTLDLSNPFSIFKLFGEAMASSKKKSNKDSIGIVYVVGAINVGDGADSPFSGGGGAYSTPIRKALDQAANDDNIKAVVLRVDSPGGSATASEIILDATKRVKAKKPLVVSMGNVAGSGGYYVSCASDTIFADAATITASIGVVSGKFVTTGMWDKVGIKFHPYQRGQNSGILSSNTVFTEAERAKMQSWMDDIYVVFKNHVIAIRGDRLKKPIDELAGGRVFTGKQALQLGLVDKIGTLSDAIAFAADQAKLSDYDIRVVPKPQNFFEKIVEEAAGGNVDPKNIGLALGLRSTNHNSLIDLALPLLQGLDPHRVTLVKTALGRMELMQREGVIVMMPEISIKN